MDDTLQFRAHKPDSSHHFPSSSRDQINDSTRCASVKLGQSSSSSHSFTATVPTSRHSADHGYTSVSAPGWEFLNTSFSDADVVQGYTYPFSERRRANYAAVSNALPFHVSIGSIHRPQLAPVPLKFVQSRKSRHASCEDGSLCFRSVTSQQLPIRTDTAITNCGSKSPSIASLTDLYLDHTHDHQTRQSATSSLDVSSFLLTLFPLPPHSTQPAIQDSSDGSRDLDEPHTPLTYSQRSASLAIFELYASPSEDSSEYLHGRGVRSSLPLQSNARQRLNTSRKPAIMLPSHPNRSDRAESNPQSTPVRPIFNDLPSAYKGITSRPYSENIIRHLPLPPVPIPTLARPSKVQDVPTSPGGQKTVTPRNPRSHSFMRRPAHASSSGSHDEAEDVANTSTLSYRYGPGAMPVFSEQIVSRPKSAQSSSALSLTESLSSKISTNQHYYDQDSIFDRILSHSSHALTGKPFRNQPRVDISIPSSSSIQEDRAEEVVNREGDEHAHVREFGTQFLLYNLQAVHDQDKPRLTRRHSYSLTLRVPSAKPTTLSPESTIGNLIAHYDRPSESSPALTRQSSIQTQHVPTEEKSAFPARTSSLLDRSKNPSKKHFQVNSDAESQHGASLPKTVSENALGPNPMGGASNLANDPMPPTRFLFPGPPTDTQSPTDSSSFQDHGKTQDLLRQDSSSPIEAGRGMRFSTQREHNPKLKHFTFDGSSSSIAGSSVSSDLNELIDARETKKLSERAIGGNNDGIPSRDHKRYSDLSRVSELDAALYFMQQAKEQQIVVDHVEQVKRHSGQSNTRSTGSAKRQAPNVSTLGTPISTARVHKSAFEKNGVIPGFWRDSIKGKPELETMAHPRETYQSHVSTKHPALEGEEQQDAGQDDVEDDDCDWETTKTEPTAPTLLPAGQSINGILSTGCFDVSNLGIHPGDNRFEYDYRLRTIAHSNESILVPRYTTSGDSFPNRNALVEPTVTVTNKSYKHASPFTPSKANTITSSPPSLPSALIRSSSPFVGPSDPSGRSQYEKVRIGEILTPTPAPLYFHGRILSVVQEHHTESSYQAGKPIQHQSIPFIEHVASEMSMSDNSEWVDCGPGPIIVSENDLGAQPSTQELMAGSRLNKMLRHDDHRMASTPLSMTNSFAKMTTLGPKANITGTPNGTGMYEVGSSVVGSTPFQFSSSPLSMTNSFAKLSTLGPKANFTGTPNGTGMHEVGSSNVGSTPVQFTSSPPVVQSSTPDNPASIHQLAKQSSPLVTDPRSPFVVYNQRQYDIPPIDFGRAVPRVNDNFGEEMTAASHSEKNPRRSVPSQKELHQMTLGLREGIDNLTRGSHVREPFDRPSHRTGSNATTRPLLPTAEKSFNLPSPHLRPDQRMPSPFACWLRAHKEAVSWASFAVFCLLPPMLVLYGFGWFDALMWFMSEYTVEHFGRTQKKAAKWVGSLGTCGIVLGIVIFWIVIKTVPNNLSR